MSMAAAPVVEADLHAFIDGELPGERRDEVLAYLASNPKAAARTESWRRQNDSLIAAFEPVAHEPVPLSLSLGISSLAPYKAAPVFGLQASNRTLDAPADPAPRVGNSDRPARSGHLLVGFMLGLAAAFALAGAIFVAIDYRKPQPVARAIDTVLTRLGQRLLEAHRAFAADRTRAYEVAVSRSGQLQRWLSQRTGFAVEPPDLSAEGLVLTGGRIIPGEAGPGALLIYETAAGERLSLLLAGPGDTSPPQGLAPNADVKQSGSLTVVSADYRSSLFAFCFSGSRDQAGRILRLIESQLPAAK